jgi:RNA polymerase sigma factor (sigma-70 family)
VEGVVDPQIELPGGVGAISRPELEDLFRRRRLAMVRLARLLTGSVGLAEEVVQDAFLKIYELPQRPRNVDAYLHTIVVNLCRNQVRHRQVEQKSSPSGKITLNIPEINDVWSLVCGLPFRQRAVLVLKFYEDLSEAEIARALDWRPGTVKSTLHRAIGKLRKELS